MPDYYEQPDYLKDLYNNQNGPTPNPTPQPEVVKPQPVAQPIPAPAAQPRPLEPQPIVPNPAPHTPAPAVTAQPATEEKGGGKRRKIFILIAVIIALVLLVIFLITLLNRNSTTEQKPSIVLQWWGAFLEPSAVQPLLDEYKVENPHVTIEYANKFRNTETYASEVTRYKDELNRVLKAGNQVEIPDIFSVDSTWVGDYEKYVKTSSSYDINTFKNSFYDVVVTNFTRNNQVYGVPLWVDTFAVVYNADMLAQNSVSTPPESWADFKTLAQNLTKRSGTTMTQAGFAAGNATNVSFAPDVLQILMLQNGAEIADTTGKPIFANDTDSLTALTFYKSFIAQNGGTWNSTFNNDASAFLDKKAAMIIVPSYRYREILRFNEQYSLGLNIKVAKIPQLETNTQDFNGADYWGNMVANNRPNSTESWKFLNWITQPDQLKKVSENLAENNFFGLLYPRKDMNTELSSDQYLRVYNEEILNAKSWYMIKGLDIEEELKTLINASSTSAGQIETAQRNIIELRTTQGQF